MKVLKWDLFEVNEIWIQRRRYLNMLKSESQFLLFIVNGRAQLCPNMTVGNKRHQNLAPGKRNNQTEH